MQIASPLQLPDPFESSSSASAKFIARNGNNEKIDSTTNISHIGSLLCRRDISRQFVCWATFLSIIYTLSLVHSIDCYSMLCDGTHFYFRILLICLGCVRGFCLLENGVHVRRLKSLLLFHRRRQTIHTIHLLLSNITQSIRLMPQQYLCIATASMSFFLVAASSSAFPQLVFAGFGAEFLWIVLLLLVVVPFHISTSEYNKSSNYYKYCYDCFVYVRSPFRFELRPCHTHPFMACTSGRRRKKMMLNCGRVRHRNNGCSQLRLNLRRLPEWVCVCNAGAVRDCRGLGPGR